MSYSGFVLVARGVLDRAADQADAGRLPDGLGSRFGRITETLLEVGRDGQVAGLDDLLGIGQRFFARDLAIALAQHARLGAARRGQRLEAQPGQDACASRRPTGWE